MLGQHAGHLVAALAAIDLLDGLAHAAMHQPVARLADFAIGHLHGQAVVEGIALQRRLARQRGRCAAAIGRVHQAGGAQLVQGVQPGGL